MTQGLMTVGSPSRPIAFAILGTTVAASLFGIAVWGPGRGALMAGAVTFGTGNLLAAAYYAKLASDRRACEADPECVTAPELGTSEDMNKYAIGAGILGVGMSGFAIYLWRTR